jgi:hypothetical protein
MSTVPNSVARVGQVQQVSLSHETAGSRIENDLPFYGIADLAKRWRCSRASVYNILRGEKVLDFAAPGHKGHKLVPIETVRRIEQRRMRVLR